MAKKLRIEDRLFLGFGLFYDYLGRNLLKAARGNYDCFIFSPPKTKKESVYNAVQKLLKTGCLERIVKNGAPYLRITGKGVEAWQRDFPLLKLRQNQWNKKWCLVIFDFPEKNKHQRESLREKLYQLGFGKLQRSVYISPYDLAEDIAEFLDDQKILGYAFVLTAPHCLMGSAKELANNVWGLEKINKEYIALLKESKKTGKIKIAPERKKALGKIYFDLVELMEKDPLLPYELLPDDWSGEKVRKQILSLLT